MGRKRSSAVEAYSDYVAVPAKKVARRTRTVPTDSVVIPIQPQIRKTFHLKDLKVITPLTDNQERAFDEWDAGQNLVLDGFPGVGKSLLAMYLALHTVLDPETPQKRVVIVRAANPTNSTVGALPGELNEKLAPYEQPYIEICNELFQWKNSYQNMKEVGIIQFVSMTYLRGISFHDAVVIIEEQQSATEPELLAAYTRIGKNTRVIGTGDFLQNDIGKKSGFMEIVPFLKKMNSVSFIEFGVHDCLRSGFVREFLMAKYN
jgi:phosphate starvation-inducible protein PhoH and related proteins